MIILLGKMALVALLFLGLCGACSVCQGLLYLPLDGFGKLCSVIVALPAYALYSRLSLSRIPRDSLKYFEISVPRHIRIAELRKK